MRICSNFREAGDNEKMTNGNIIKTDINFQRLIKSSLVLIFINCIKNVNCESPSAFVPNHGLQSTVGLSSSFQPNPFVPSLCNKNRRHVPQTTNNQRNNHPRNWLLRNNISRQENDNMSVNSLGTIDLFNADIKRMVDRTTRTAPGYYNPVDAAERANAMLHHMLKTYQTSGGTTAAKPNRESFRLVLQGYVNLGSTTWQSSKSNGDNNSSIKDNMTNGAIRIEQLFQEMLDFLGEDNFIADMEIINLILKSFAVCSSITPTKNISDNDDLNDNIDNSSLSFAQKSDLILKKYVVIEKNSNDILLLKQYAQSFAYTIEAWSYHHHRQTHIGKKNNNDNLGIGQESYVRDNLDQTKSASIIHVNTLLEQLQYIYQLMNQTNIENSNMKRRQIEFVQRLLVWAYGDIIEAWCNFDRSFNSAKHAESALIQMETITMVDNFISNITTDFEKDSDISGKKHVKFLPSVREYNNVILAFSQIQFDDSKKNRRRKRQIEDSSKNTRSAAQCAHDLLKKMLQLYDTGKWGSRNKPGPLAFNAVITAWSNNAVYSGKSAEMAEAVLQLFENLYLDQSKTQYDFAPDNVSYNAAITAWANCREVASVHKAEELLQQMTKNSKRYKENNLEPDAFTYNAITNAWIRSGLGVTSAENAEKYLKIMENGYFQKGRRDLKPNVKNYSAVINAWAKCGAKDGLGAYRALELLDHMEAMYDSDIDDANNHHKKSTNKTDKISHFYSRNVSENKNDYDGPDVIIYTNVIDAFAQSRLPEAADIALQLLDRLEDRVDRQRSQLVHKDKGKKSTPEELHSMMPNVRTYTSVILALANTRQEGNIKKAQSILNHMNEIYSKTGNKNVLPNIFTYNYIINCAANTLGSGEKEGNIDNEKQEAFKFALNAFQELRKNANANSFTYAFFIKACVNLLPISNVRTKIIEQAFQECCKDGQVTDQVIKRVLRGVPQSKSIELLSESITVEHMKFTKSLNDLKAVHLDPNVTRNTRIRR